jgi:hypothetical protein
LGDDDTPSREDPHRVGAVLRDIAKGRALLENRKTVTIEDIVVSARIALSTMPSKRRLLVRALLNPVNGQRLTTSEAKAVLGTSKPTTLNRMRELDTLAIAEFKEDEDDGRSPKSVVLKQDFEWPDVLPFPDR